MRLRDEMINTNHIMPENLTCEMINIDIYSLYIQYHIYNLFIIKIEIHHKLGSQGRCYCKALSRIQRLQRRF